MVGVIKSLESTRVASFNTFVRKIINGIKNEKLEK